MTGDAFHAPALRLGFVPGLLITSVLQANNLSDIPGDRRAGVRTLAVRLGFDSARALYIGSLTLTYATIVGLVVIDLFGWPLLLVALTLPIACRRVQQARAADAEGNARLVDLAPQPLSCTCCSTSG